MVVSTRRAIVALMFSVGLASVAQAQTPAAQGRGPDRAALEFTYLDLDVDTSDGMRSLTLRINDAARRVCRISADYTVFTRGAEFACRQGAKLQAWEDFHRDRAQARQAASWMVRAAQPPISR